MQYRNGREAKFGDPVVGVVSDNGGRIIAGTIMARTTTPGYDSCVTVISPLTIPIAGNEEVIKRGKIILLGPEGKSTIYLTYNSRVHGTQNNGADGDLALTFFLTDYIECKDLMHAEDMWNDSKHILMVPNVKVGELIMDGEEHQVDMTE